MSIESISSSSVNQEAMVSLMQKSKAQDEAVMGILLDGIKQSADSVQNSMQNREAFGTGLKLNAIA